MVLDPSKEVFVVHMTYFGKKMSIHLTWEAQIILLLTEKVTVLVKYLDFANIFSKKLVVELIKYSDINKYLINLELGKQPFYRPIYSSMPIELKIFKTYIKTNIANSFICPSKSSVKTLIFFIQKSNGSFYLCIDYQDPNNLTIKNEYPLLLISKSLD